MDEVDLFEKVDIRIGKVLDVEIHPNADSMYVEKIDIGEDEPRTIVSGLRNHISIDDFKGQFVLVVCNLKPRKLREILSNGMVLCASNEDHTIVELLKPKIDNGNDPVVGVVGQRIIFEGFEGFECDAHPARLNPKKKIWEKVGEYLKVNVDKFATYKDKKLCTTTQKFIVSSNLSNCSIG